MENTTYTLYKKNRIDLSNYISIFASSVSTANKTMSEDSFPMIVKEAEFKVNITTEMDINDEKEGKETSLQVVGMSLQQKLITDYKEHFGVEMRFVLSPAMRDND